MWQLKPAATNWVKLDLSPLQAVKVVIANNSNYNNTSNTNTNQQADYVLIQDNKGDVYWMRANNPAFRFHNPAYWQLVAAGVRDLTVARDGCVILQIRGAEQLYRIDLK